MVTRRSFIGILRGWTGGMPPRDDGRFYRERAREGTEGPIQPLFRIGWRQPTDSIPDILATASGSPWPRGGDGMRTRRDILRLVPAAALLAVARAAEGPDFGRVDTHIHIHRDAPALIDSPQGVELARAGHRRLPGRRRRAVRPGGEAPRHAQGRRATAAARWPGRRPSTPAAFEGPGLRRPHHRPPRSDPSTTGRSA